MHPDPAPAHALLTRLKLRHLRLLLALSQRGSAAAVATQFHVSPAAVSKALAEIEDIAGTPLFERNARGMRPTPAGSELIAGAGVVIAQIERLAESLQAVRTGTQGQLTLAFRTNSVQPFLAQAVAAFQEQYPGVTIHVVEGGIGDLIHRLSEGDLDLLFAYEDPRLERRELDATPIVAGQDVVVVASPAHPLRRRKRLAASDLLEQRWCIPADGSRMLHHLQTAFRSLGQPVPSRGIHTSDVAMTVNLLQHAGYLAVYPRRIANQLAAAGTACILPVPLPCRVEPVVAVWNRLLVPRAPAQVFREFVVRQAEENGLRANG
ncbi:LysR family transcriptional regulator [Imbroritus primus]|uniref:LysR family transcriptional regulator n=1 Tax=Imbroritus primus TaxID=3058603 RepID=A0ACD3SPH9_9BURK|nr:LysR family transcriptional regulator [Burkholderiaceae bacterium PBA]